MQVKGSRVFLWYVQSESGKPLPARTSGYVAATSYSPNPISPSDWSFSLDQASRGIEIPLAHLLLNAASCAAADMDVRKSILDACAAAEIGIRDAMRQKLMTIGEGVLVDHVLTSTRGIDRLAQLARKFGIPVSTNAVRGIAEPRNQVAHKGDHPTLTVAHEVIGRARDILRLVCPIGAAVASRE